MAFQKLHFWTVLEFLASRYSKHFRFLTRILRACIGYFYGTFLSRDLKAYHMTFRKMQTKDSLNIVYLQIWLSKKMIINDNLHHFNSNNLWRNCRMMNEAFSDSMNLKLIAQLINDVITAESFPSRGMIVINVTCVTSGKNYDLTWWNFKSDGDLCAIVIVQCGTSRTRTGMNCWDLTSMSIYGFSAEQTSKFDLELLPHQVVNE